MHFVKSFWPPLSWVFLTIYQLNSFEKFFDCVHLVRLMFYLFLNFIQSLVKLIWLKGRRVTKEWWNFFLAFSWQWFHKLRLFFICQVDDIFFCLHVEQFKLGTCQKQFKCVAHFPKVFNESENVKLTSKSVLSFEIQPFMVIVLKTIKL